MNDRGDLDDIVRAAPREPMFRSRQRNRRGQSTVEYVLMISVIVIATVWIAGDYFWPKYADGLDAMQGSLSDMVSDGVVEGR